MQVLLLTACAVLRGPGPPPATDELKTLEPEVAEAARVQIWLSRTPWQPGSIDGQLGTNAQHALMAFQRANELPETGHADVRTLTKLREAVGDDRPLTTRYRLTEDDVDGPFADIPEGLYEAHALECMCYRSPWEELAERFQVSPELLSELNPRANLERLEAGDKLVVPDPEPVVPLTTPVARIRIDVEARTLTALDAQGKVLRQYPTVVGDDFATYRGELTIVGVARDPTYRMDPAVWTELPRDWPAVTIPPGPNSPVGVVWMQLSEEGYGIHGTGDPETIGHTESHGCVRLTNWSALELSEHVQPGVTEVEFVGMGQG